MRHRRLLVIGTLTIALTVPAAGSLAAAAGPPAARPATAPATPDRPTAVQADGDLPTTCPPAPQGDSLCVVREAPEAAPGKAADVGAAVIDRPEWCEDLDRDAVWHQTRFEACRNSSFRIEMRRNNVVVGTIRGDLDQRTYLDVPLGVWLHDLEFTVERVTGLAVLPGTVLGGTLSCDAPCTVATSDFLPQPAGIGSSPEGTGDLDLQPMAEDAVATARSTWSVVAANPFFRPSAPALITGPRVRCDNAIGNAAGCVFPAHAPDMRYFGFENPQFFRHVSAAQASGLPSRLHRITDGDDRDANGERACPRAWTRPADPDVPDQTLDCDEYPFRSTREGAATSGAPQSGARTFEFCNGIPLPTGVTGPDGWSSCFINLNQNRSAGGKLSNFYIENRVLDGDAFDVVMVP